VICGLTRHTATRPSNQRFFLYERLGVCQPFAAPRFTEVGRLHVSQGEIGKNSPIYSEALKKRNVNKKMRTWVAH